MSHRRTLIVVLAGYALWVATWYAVQLLGAHVSGSGRSWIVLLFMLTQQAVAGILVPLLIGARADLLDPDDAGGERSPTHRVASRARRSRTSVAIGSAALVVALVLGLGASGAMATVLADAPSPGVIVRYLILFPGMAFAVTLYCFWLVPRAVRRALGGGPMATVAAALAGSLAVAIGFWADGLGQDAGLAATQALVGFAVVTGALLTDSRGATYATYFAIMLVNTLAEDKYGAIAWWALILGGIAVVTAFMVGTHAARARAGREALLAAH